MSAEFSILQCAIRPALQSLPDNWNTPAAQVMMLTIMGQEADFKHRWQVIDPKDPMKKGPARGLAQMERGGGAIKGIFDGEAFPRLAAIMKQFSIARGVGPTADDRFHAVEVDDIYAAGLTRGLLFSDPKPMPAVGDEDGAFQLYLRTWRPGAYTRGTILEKALLRKKWHGYYARAVAAVTGQ